MGRLGGPGRFPADRKHDCGSNVVEGTLSNGKRCGREGEEISSLGRLQRGRPNAITATGVIEVRRSGRGTKIRENEREERWTGFGSRGDVTAITAQKRWERWEVEEERGRRVFGFPESPTSFSQIGGAIWKRRSRVKPGNHLRECDYFFAVFTRCCVCAI